MSTSDSLLASQSRSNLGEVEEFSDMNRSDDFNLVPHIKERIEITIPSDLDYMHSVLSYMLERVAEFGIAEPASCNLLVALDEAITNAIKHGNKSDPEKKVKIVAELSAEEARFTIRDEGDGFNPAGVPDPTDPDRLLNPHGRGILFMNHIMDEVHYNERGNEITLIKRAPQGPSPEDSGQKAEGSRR